MKQNPFKSVRPSSGSNTKSINWYRNQVKRLSNITPNTLLSNTPGLTTTLKPGHMYMFFYDAKYKDTLPFWDRFPLVIPFRKAPDGFYGINLHYLPYVMRFNLLGALHRYAADDSIGENTKLKINWNLLEEMSSVAPIKKCVKHYLSSHVKSKFLEISYPDWITASLLPVEQFEGATKNTVWENTRRA